MVIVTDNKRCDRQLCLPFAERQLLIVVDG